MNEVLWGFFTNNIGVQIVFVENISFFAFVVFSLCNIEIWRYEVRMKRAWWRLNAGNSWQTLRRAWVICV